MSKTKINPLPWKFNQREVTDANGECVVFRGVGNCLGGPPDDSDERTAFMVRAVNAHDDLLAALQGMIEGAVSSSINAVHPSGRFCHRCGRNSEKEVHSDNCPVKLAEDAIAKATAKV